MAYTLRDNLSPFFTVGRQNGIKRIVIHHAATTYFDGIGQTFKSRGVSAHYGVGEHNNVDRYVNEGNIAYHAGNWPINVDSIGIEHVNKTGAPNWLVDDAVFNTSVELVGKIAARHGLLPLKVGKNLTLSGHKDHSATACPMQLYGRLQELADKVNGYKKPSVGPAPAKKSVNRIARDVIAGKYGNMPQRKANVENRGYNFGEVQREVNRLLGAPSAPKPPERSVNAVARDVIAGAYGNMPQRKTNVERAGYNFAAVQAEVNKILGVGTVVPSGGVFAVGQRVVVTNPVSYEGAGLGTSGVYSVMEVRGDRIVIGRGGQVTAALKNTSLRKA